MKLAVAVLAALLLGGGAAAGYEIDSQQHQIDRLAAQQAEVQAAVSSLSQTATAQQSAATASVAQQVTTLRNLLGEANQRITSLIQCLEAYEPLNHTSYCRLGL